MSDNILDQMGIRPFDDTDEDFAPPTKYPTSIRLSAATKRQIGWLKSAGHGKQSEIIAIAIHAMWLREQQRDVIKPPQLPPDLIIERQQVTADGKYMCATCVRKQHESAPYVTDTIDLNKEIL